MLENLLLLVGTRPGRLKKGTTSGMGLAAPLIEQSKCHGLSAHTSHKEMIFNEMSVLAQVCFTVPGTTFFVDASPVFGIYN